MIAIYCIIQIHIEKPQSTIRASEISLEDDRRNFQSLNSQLPIDIDYNKYGRSNVSDRDKNSQNLVKHFPSHLVNKQLLGRPPYSDHANQRGDLFPVYFSVSSVKMRISRQWLGWFSTVRVRCGYGVVQSRYRVGTVSVLIS